MSNNSNRSLVVWAPGLALALTGGAGTWLINGPLAATHYVLGVIGCAFVISLINAKDKSP